jgi:nicotinamide-nucleotide amidase
MTTTDLAHQLGDLLNDRNLSLATAESCTGGLIGHLVTEIAGSSAYYNGGIVAYSNAIKRDLLGVPQGTLDSVGAVSEETARAMASGVRQRIGADVGVATTGIAGPDGSTATKPVGLVFIAVATPSTVVCERHVFGGDRHAVKQQTATAALRLLLNVLH